MLNVNVNVRSEVSGSEIDNTTPTTTIYPCANYLNSMKEHISVLNTEITAVRSFILEQMIILKNQHHQFQILTRNKFLNISTQF